MIDDNKTYTITAHGGLTEVGNAYLAHALSTQAKRYKHAAWLGPVEDAPDGGLVRFEFTLRGDRPYAIVSSPAQDVVWNQQAADRGVSLHAAVLEVIREGIDVRGPDGGVFRFTYAVKEAPYE